MRLGIDASNLRMGGGLMHLVETLRVAEPRAYGINEVTVWAGQHTHALLPERDWLCRRHEPLLDQSLPARLYWQHAVLPRLAARDCDCLFVPGGSCSVSFQPLVAMSQNLLPFEWRELRRYWASWMALKLLLLRRGTARTMRRADGAIFLTEYAHQTIAPVARLGAEHTIIPYGLGRQFFLPPRPQRPAHTFTPDDPCKLLYVSNLEPYKHHWHLVAAVAQLWRAGLAVHLELIGAPANAGAARRLRAALDAADPRGEFITYHGGVAHAEMVARYHQADLFIFASSCESLPNILLEAMAAGLPIACARRGPMPEVLRTGGVYFDPEQPDEIAAALKQLIADHELRARCAATAYELAQGYSWEQCARATFAYLAAVSARVRHEAGAPARSDVRQAASLPPAS